MDEYQPVLLMVHKFCTYPQKGSSSHHLQEFSRLGEGVYQISSINRILLASQEMGQELPLWMLGTSSRISVYLSVSPSDDDVDVIDTAEIERASKFENGCFYLRKPF